MSIFITILQVLAGLAVTVIVLAQSGKSAGLSGTISGGADTFMSKGKAKSLDAKLAKLTKWFALGFVVLTLVLNLMSAPAATANEQQAADPSSSEELQDEEQGEEANEDGADTTEENE
jgi:preprotein translocase subunit SecG